MTTFAESMSEYRKKLQLGTVQQAYRGLMEFMASLRMRLQEKHPEYAISGSIYQGYMDMTYFALTPLPLKEHGLKVAVVFAYETFCFEVWLAAVNKSVQKEYWEMIKASEWSKYPTVATITGADAIIEHVLVENPDFGNLAALSEAIETGTMNFITDVDCLLQKL
jgi:hypothetical protein